MAAADLVMTKKVATVESDDDGPYTVQLSQAECFLTYAKSADVAPGVCYVQFDGDVGDLQEDGLQSDGSIALAKGDSIPIPRGSKFVHHNMASGKTAILWVTVR